MHIFCSDKTQQITTDQNRQSSLTARVKALLTFDPNLQHL